ncbi:MAG: PspC domain-containing protein [Acidimicrobiales bacterium]
MNRRDERLYRDTDDKMIGGVASGLGHYFDVDTVLFRVGFVVLSLIGGGGLVAYVLLWIILDPAPLATPTLPPGAAIGPVVDGVGPSPALADQVETTVEEARDSEVTDR